MRHALMPPGQIRTKPAPILAAAADALIGIAGPPEGYHVASDFLMDKASTVSLLAGIGTDPVMNLFGAKRAPDGLLGVGLPALKRQALSIGGMAGPAGGGHCRLSCSSPWFQAAFEARLRRLQESSCVCWLSEPVNQKSAPTYLAPRYNSRRTW